MSQTDAFVYGVDVTTKATVFISTKEDFFSKETLKTTHNVLAGNLDAAIFVAKAIASDKARKRFDAHYTVRVDDQYTTSAVKLSRVDSYDKELFTK